MSYQAISQLINEKEGLKVYGGVIILTSNSYGYYNVLYILENWSRRLTD